MHYMQDSKEKQTKADQDYGRIDNINEDIESIGLILRGAMDLTKD